MLPREKPKIDRDDLLERFSLKFPEYEWDWDKYPVFCMGTRGFYPTTEQWNKVNVYDDAVAILSKSGHFETFNFNTDPQALEAGRPFLKEGIWLEYKLGLHKQSYAALRQIGPVDVLRYNPSGAPRPDRGRFGINIHSGGESRTNSLGCQTVPPWQYPFFMVSLIQLDKQGRKDGQIPYVLINNK